MKKRVLITLIASIIIIIMMMWLADPRELGDSFRRSNLHYILLVILLYFVNVVTKAVRWYLLVNTSGMHIPLSKTFPFYIIALAFNNLTPGKIGGEPVRAYLLKKEANVPIGQGIASIFAEKYMDLIVITTMAVIGAIFIIPLLPQQQAKILIIILILAVASLIAALIIVSHSTILKKTVDGSVNLAKKVSNGDSINRLSFALVGFTEKFRFGMGKILKARNTAIACMTLTVIIWINEALRLFIILLALPDIEGVSIGAVFIASSIANILGIALPLGSGNILGIGAVFMAVGMDSSDAGSASFMHVATSIWISVPLGVIAMLLTGFKTSKLAEKV